MEDIDDVAAALSGSDDKGQWKGIEDVVEGIDDVAAALSVTEDVV